MKQGKSAGSTWVLSEMLKAASGNGALWMIDVCDTVGGGMVTFLRILSGAGG